MRHQMYALVDEKIEQTIAMYWADDDEIAIKKSKEFIEKVEEQEGGRKITSMYVRKVGTFNTTKGIFEELSDKILYDTREEKNNAVLHEEQPTTEKRDTIGNGMGKEISDGAEP